MSLWETYGGKFYFKTIPSIPSIPSILSIGGNIEGIEGIEVIPLILKNAGYPYRRLCPYPGLGNEFVSCEWWNPAMKQEFERKYGIQDMRGMGIDSGALPEVLAGFSQTGWRLELAASGKIKMIAVASNASNKDGNKDYLRVMGDKIRHCLVCLNGGEADCYKRLKA